MAKKEEISKKEFKVLSKEADKHYSKPISPYEINTGSVFLGLNGDDSKWRRYDREFLRNTLQEAFEYIFDTNKIVSVPYDGSNGHYLDKVFDVDYPRELERAQKEEFFPFPSYYLKKDKNPDYYCIVDYSAPFYMKIVDRWYDLFFALQLSLTEIIEREKYPVDEFLQYHYVKAFKGNLNKYKEYLQNICIKYSEFLKEKFADKVDHFIEKLEKKKLDKLSTKLKIKVKTKEEEPVVQKATEQPSNSAPNNTKENPFDYSNNEGHFVEPKLKEFAEIELNLFNVGFFTKEGIKKKQVAFIHLLYKYGYITPAKYGEKKKNRLLDHRRFFEKRYNIDISNTFKPSQFKIDKLDDYELYFSMIPEIMDKIEKRNN